VGAAGFGEQLREGGFGGPFVDGIVVRVGLQRGVIFPDRRGIVLDFRGHAVVITEMNHW